MLLFIIVNVDLQDSWCHVGMFLLGPLLTECGFHKNPQLGWQYQEFRAAWRLRYPSRVSSQGNSKSASSNCSSPENDWMMLDDVFKVEVNELIQLINECGRHSIGGMILQVPLAFYSFPNFMCDFDFFLHWTTSLSLPMPEWNRFFSFSSPAVEGLNKTKHSKFRLDETGMTLAPFIALLPVVAKLMVKHPALRRPHALNNAWARKEAGVSLHSG